VRAPADGGDAVCCSGGDGAFPTGGELMVDLVDAAGGQRAEEGPGPAERMRQRRGETASVRELR